MSWKENKEWLKFKASHIGKMGVIIVKISEKIMIKLDETDEIDAKKMIKEADQYGEVTSIIRNYIAQTIFEFHYKGEQFANNLKNAYPFN